MLQVLLLEDDPEDRFITAHFTEDLKDQIEVTFVTHSNELFDILQNNSLPDLLLIDMNSKPDDGMQVLKKLKAHKNYQYIPVVLLTDKVHDEHVKNCYINGAASVIRKPDSYEATKNKISIFFSYWSNAVELKK